MQADISQISRLVFELLKDSPPELAARLKQRINISLVKSGFNRFDEKAFGNKRFTDFLQKHFAETLTLIPPVGQGDVLVALREPTAVHAAQIEAPNAELAGVLEKPVVRSDVWQAFLNQDKERRRFFSKADGKVVHYRNAEPADIKAAVEATPADYVEILPIPEQTQLDWFRAFLQKNPANPRYAGAIQQLLDADIGSVAIESITHMLASQGDVWRAQRARLIHAHIAEWCAKHGLRAEAICNPPKVQPASKLAPPATAIESSTAVRKQAQAILDSLSDGDIAQIVLPILVTTVLVRART